VGFPFWQSQRFDLVLALHQKAHLSMAPAGAEPMEGAGYRPASSDGAGTTRMDVDREGGGGDKKTRRGRKRKCPHEVVTEGPGQAVTVASCVLKQLVGGPMALGDLETKVRERCLNHLGPRTRRSGGVDVGVVCRVLRAIGLLRFRRGGGGGGDRAAPAAGSLSHHDGDPESDPSRPLSLSALILALASLELMPQPLATTGQEAANREMKVPATPAARMQVEMETGGRPKAPASDEPIAIVKETNSFASDLSISSGLSIEEYKTDIVPGSYSSCASPMSRQTSASLASISNRSTSGSLDSLARQESVASLASEMPSIAESSATPLPPREAAGSTQATGRSASTEGTHSDHSQALDFLKDGKRPVVPVPVPVAEGRDSVGGAAGHSSKLTKAPKIIRALSSSAEGGDPGQPPPESEELRGLVEQGVSVVSAAYSYIWRLSQALPFSDKAFELAKHGRFDVIEASYGAKASAAMQAWAEYKTIAEKEARAENAEGEPEPEGEAATLVELDVEQDRLLAEVTEVVTQVNDLKRDVDRLAHEEDDLLRTLVQKYGAVPGRGLAPPPRFGTILTPRPLPTFTAPPVRAPVVEPPKPAPAPAPAPASTPAPAAAAPSSGPEETDNEDESLLPSGERITDPMQLLESYSAKRLVSRARRRKHKSYKPQTVDGATRLAAALALPALEDAEAWVPRENPLPSEVEVTAVPMDIEEALGSDVEEGLIKPEVVKWAWTETGIEEALQGTRSITWAHISAQFKPVNAPGTDKVGGDPIGGLAGVDSRLHGPGSGGVQMPECSVDSPREHDSEIFRPSFRLLPTRDDEEADDASSDEDISDEAVLVRHETRLKEIWTRYVAARKQPLTPTPTPVPTPTMMTLAPPPALFRPGSLSDITR
jgi:hypothetical protein